MAKGLFTIFKELNDRPFKVGETDCFKLTIDFLKMRGCHIDDDIEINGLTFKNYARHYIVDKGTIRYAITFISKYLPAKHTGRFYGINPNKISAGDILILKKEDEIYFGICAGNSNIMTSNEKRGVFIMKQEKGVVSKAFRWVPQLH